LKGLIEEVGFISGRIGPVLKAEDGIEVMPFTICRYVG